MLKKEWIQISNRIKNGSGLAPEKEPTWYKHMNPVFSETNEEVNIVSSAADLSYVNDRLEEDDVNGETDHMQSSEPHESVEAEDSNSEEGEAVVQKRRKVVVAPHNKGKVVPSNKQALSEVTCGLKAVAEAQMKHHKETLEAERRRDEMLLRHRETEAEKNRAHEIRLAEIFARAAASNQTSHQTPVYGLPIISSRWSSTPSSQSVGAASTPSLPVQFANNLPMEMPNLIVFGHQPRHHNQSEMQIISLICPWTHRTILNLWPVG